MNASTTQSILDLLKPWAVNAQQWWVDLPSTQGRSLGFYGTGYNAWGVQTNQKYLAAMAMLGTATDDSQAIERALASLRFSLASHTSAQDHDDAITCTDGSRWGCTWISSLGVERMMFAVHALQEHLTQQDHAALRRMLTAEALWQCDHHHRGQHHGVMADRWNATGRNNPESNIWNGAVLWRTAQMYPDHPDAAKWRDKAEDFLFNGVSIEADAGHPRYVGANFFPNYALDHHGYFNVGYMVICLSNAALLHFDLKARGLPRPEFLDHHQADLWRVLRPMIFTDGRLARLGGDSRLRYTYCQEYLLPSLLYAADQLGDPAALELVPVQLELIQTEQAYAGDGSFYGRRLAQLATSSPYYYTRLESDRACVLGSLLAYLPLLEKNASAGADVEVSREQSAVQVNTSWHEPEYGAMLHRSEHRLASFSWRAHGLTQGLCLPPHRSDMAEWSCNLAGRVRFIGDPGPTPRSNAPHRTLLAHHSQTFPGGFVTTGSVREGVNLTIPEGMNLTDLATHHLCFAALPDGHSVVGLQLVILNDKHAWSRQIKGLGLNIPNDLYNSFERTLDTAGGQRLIASPARRDQTIDLQSHWACIDQCVGVIGLYGASTLMLDRTAARQGGYYPSLYVDELCWACDTATVHHPPGQTLLDVGWRIISGATPQETQAMASADQFQVIPVDPANKLIREIIVTGCDQKRYHVRADFALGRAQVR